MDESRSEALFRGNVHVLGKRPYLVLALQRIVRLFEAELCQSPTLIGNRTTNCCGFSHMNTNGMADSPSGYYTQAWSIRSEQRNRFREPLFCSPPDSSSQPHQHTPVSTREDTPWEVWCLAGLSILLLSLLFHHLEASTEKKQSWFQEEEKNSDKQPLPLLRSRVFHEMACTTHAPTQQWKQISAIKHISDLMHFYSLDQ